MQRKEEERSDSAVNGQMRENAKRKPERGHARALRVKLLLCVLIITETIVTADIKFLLILLVVSLSLK